MTTPHVRSYVCPPKHGCTYFNRLWVKSTRDVKLSSKLGGLHHPRNLIKYNLRYLNSYSESEIRTRLQTYFKVVVARHPMVRLLSAYRNKLERKNNLFERIAGRESKKRYFLGNQSKDDQVTFEQFVHYLVDTDPARYDKHGLSIIFSCHLCEIQYDYVAKIETSYVDYPRIVSLLKNISESKKRNLQKSIIIIKQTTHSDRVNEYYSPVPAKHLKIIVYTRLTWFCSVTHGTKRHYLTAVG